MLLLLSWIGWVHASGVVINEVVIDSEGSEESWIELYNSSDAAVDIAGWSLEWGVAAASYDGAIVFDALEIEAGGFLLVGGTAISDAAVVTELTFGAGSENSDAIRLVDAEDLYTDTLVYGSPNTDEWLDDLGAIAASTVESPSVGFSVGRVSDGVDSDDSGEDFVLFASPTPGSTNTPVVEDPGCPGSESLKINELMYNPPGVDTGHEWVEIYNAGTETVELAGWQLEAAITSLSVDVVFESGVTLAAGDFLLVGEPEVADADLTVSSLTLGNAGSNADLVRLVDCAGDIADTLVYGEPNSDLWVDDSGEVATSMAPTAPEPKTIARAEDGLDTDASGEDFVVLETPTPGASNTPPDPIDSGTPEDSGLVDTGVVIDTGSAPSTCTVSTDIKINEAQIIPVTTPDEADHEWVELYNRGSVSVNLNGWRLEAGASEVDVVINFDADAVIAPGAFL